MESNPKRASPGVWRLGVLAAAIAGISAVAAPVTASAAISCARDVSADIVVIDQPIMYNRLGAGNVNGQMYALRRDVINSSTKKPLTVDPSGAVAGQVELRPDKHPRPMILRVAAGDCLTVKLTNLLTPQANPNNVPEITAAGQVFNVFVDGQVKTRFVGFQASGTELRDSINDDGSNVGRNSTAAGAGAAGSLIAPGESRTYRLFAPKEGAFAIKDQAATVGSDANQGSSSNGLFGSLIVEPKGAKTYRSQIFEEEMRLASGGLTTPTGQPTVNYEATYPMTSPWIEEGKAGLPIVNMDCNAAAAATGKCTLDEIVHSEINAVVVGPNADGTFPPSTYPLESVGKRNPSLPNRLEPFRDFASIYHDEPATAQAFPGFYNHPQFKYVLAGVKDGFMINYGSGGIGSEIIANRLGVGPMHDCLSCAYEEFFLTSFAVGDPGMTVDIPANLGLETLAPGQAPNPAALGPKANYAIGAEDPANIHHSYIGDFVKIRNIHVGKEQHVFHLHNHQWLYNPNDDNSNYLDAQGIGPGVGYTYEINYGGSGNRNKTAGDAIYHCHFYPHFAQGMWYHWRNHDVFEAGTKLAASGAGFHTTPWALGNTTPAAGARALPDGEIVAGTPIPGLVPLPGKGLAPMPGNDVSVVAKIGANGATLGSVSRITGDRTKNPGYPFWIAGMEEIVGQRPPTPLLDMLNKTQAQALKAMGGLWANIDPAQADGFDGGLRRHALQGVADGGVALSTVSAIDFSKVMEVAKPVYYPEEGTDLEQAAMAFHAQRTHATSKVNLDGSVAAATFTTNGSGGPSVGAPFHEPCIDDIGQRMNAGVVGQFFSGETMTGMSTRGSSLFSATNPRIYKGTNIQFDAIFNKVGYHYPQQRIVALWADAVPVINKVQPPEPLVMRLNTFDCAVYHHSNLVPEVLEMDDFQVRTPTDIIGQHIHLPKWDLTTTDGAANGWNYEDGTLSPGTVRERIHAIRHFNHCVGTDSGDPRDNTDACPVAKPHPYFGQFGREDWIGARTTQQRWFADPLVNTDGVDRGLGIIFTHDHYGPSSHQQIGLYSTVLTEPAGAKWVHNETGEQLGYDPVSGAPARTIAMLDGSVASDGGPTSWQAAIIPPSAAPGGSNVKSETLVPYREFYFEYSDFQHAYEKGVYVGAGPDGRALPGATPMDRFTGVPAIGDAFRFAINPPAREQFMAPVFPNLVLEVAAGLIPGCPVRPCPQAISVADPGMFVVNYRNEPVALRVFDPNKVGPDGKKGAQADGLAGDLAFALSTQIMDKKGVTTPLVRAIPEMNLNDATLAYTQKPLNQPNAMMGNDPFTPMLRVYPGDLVRIKAQAGAHEEEHAVTFNGVKWLQAGSGHGQAKNSGWRNSQAAGISEQFTFQVPIQSPAQVVKAPAGRDYAYNIDASMDGWWSGTWGVMRAYDTKQADLIALPNNDGVKPDRVANKQDFNGVCPVTAPVRKVNVVALLANDFLPKPAGVTIVPNDPNLATQHAGGPLNANGGTLVYNSRNDAVFGGNTAPLHDPTAILYVRASDLEPVNPAAGACKDGNNGRPGVANPACPVRLKAGFKVEPLIIRANAGDCVEPTLYSRLPAVMPDLPGFGTLIGVVKRERNVIDNGINIGSTPFDNNLVRPSGHAGLHTQLVATDVGQDDGMNVGINIVQTVAPVDATGKGDNITYRWYAGDLSNSSPSAPTVTLAATPVEFGGSSLMPADKVKQGQKSMVGGLVIVPQGASIADDAGQHAQSTVAFEGRQVRDFHMVMTKDLSMRYANGNAVEHIQGEGLGIPEDSQENTHTALNYGTEPLWLRLGLKPNAAFGNANCAGPDAGDVPGPCYGGADTQNVFSNQQVGGQDPQTPVFNAAAGQEVRLHIAVPHGTSRGTTYAINGHVWQRDPYVCPGESRNGLIGACNLTSVGSQRIGNNPMGFAQGAQESNTPSAHFTHLLPSAGGGNQVKGDYLIRDGGSFGQASGLWAILRVQ